MAKTQSKSIVKLATKFATKLATKLTTKAATKPIKPLASAKAVKPAPKLSVVAKTKKEALVRAQPVKIKAVKPDVATKPEKQLSKPAEKPMLKLVKQDAKSVEVSATKAAPVVLTAEASPKAKKLTKAAKADKSLMNLSERPLGELQKKWSEYKEKYGKEKAPVYNMANTYEAAAPLQHKVLGWGFVVSVQNDRLEVLFESGSKVLISNYRPR